MDRHEPRDPAAVWRAQPMEAVAPTVDQVRARAQWLESAVRRRNRLEYAASALGIAVFAAYAWLFPVPLMRIGCVLVVAAILFVGWSLHVRGSSRPLPVGLPLAGYLRRHREELVRQERALRSAWRWYLAPFAPGLVLFLAGCSLAYLPGRWLPVSAGIVLLLGSFAGIWQLNVMAARGLRRQTVGLDALLRDLDSGQAK